MFLRFNRRFKDGKEHRYWNIVENKRCASGKVVQRQVLYLGEINDSQREAWCRLIEAFDEDAGRHKQLALFPADRAVPAQAKTHGVQVHDLAGQWVGRRRNPACWPSSIRRTRQSEPRRPGPLNRRRGRRDKEGERFATSSLATLSHWAPRLTHGALFLFHRIRGVVNGLEWARV